MKVVILAGGLGTRISEYTKDHTKTDDKNLWETNNSKNY